MTEQTEPQAVAIGQRHAYTLYRKRLLAQRQPAAPARQYHDIDEACLPGINLNLSWHAIPPQEGTLQCMYRAVNKFGKLSDEPLLSAMCSASAGPAVQCVSAGSPAQDAWLGHISIDPAKGKGHAADPANTRGRADLLAILQQQVLRETGEASSMCSGGGCSSSNGCGSSSSAAGSRRSAADQDAWMGNRWGGHVSFTIGTREQLITQSAPSHN